MAFNPVSSFIFHLGFLYLAQRLLMVTDLTLESKSNILEIVYWLEMQTPFTIFDIGGLHFVMIAYDV